MKQSLSSWFAIGHPTYRVLLAQVLLAGTIAAVLAYLDNFLLSSLTESLTISMGTGAVEADTLPGVFVRLSDGIGLGLPLVVLAVFGVAQLVAAGVEFWKQRASGRLQITSRNDLETAILHHLLHKDDSFFSSHSPGETINRLTMDIQRVSGRRNALLNIWCASVLILGNLAFFLQKDWRLALLGMASCAGGALLTYRITRNVKGLDRRYMRRDDQVKARFEDFLRAVPEIQVGNLYGKVRGQFTELQGARAGLFRKFIGLRSWISVTNILTSLGAFTAMIGLLLYMARGGEPSSALILVPAVIWALPRLFKNASDLIFINLQFQMARTSMDRLMEYESLDAVADSERRVTVEVDASNPEPVTLTGATYQYTGPDGHRQGGVVGVETHFAPDRWTAIVGGAGSGKSTALKMLLGRFRPQEGSARYGDHELAGLAPESSAAILSVMPQAPALLNATIEDNLTFGRAGDGGGPPDRVTDADLEQVEQIGLGAVCRLKSLDMQPGSEGGDSELAAGIGELRRMVRRHLLEELSLEVHGYEDAPEDRRQWIVESLIGGRCNRKAAVGAIVGGKGECRELQSVAASSLCDLLSPVGRDTLRSSQNLLRLPSYQAYSQLAPFPLDQRIWQLRTDLLEVADTDPLPAKATRELLGVALTTSPLETGGGEAPPSWSAGDAARFSAEIDHLRGLLEGHWHPFEIDRVHPYLNWRENLIFGTFEVRNSRKGRQVDLEIQALLQEQGLERAVTRLGLGFDIGRMGSNLSGGQGQLVALGRAVLRRTPVLVLDEPTSALDPASCSRVGEFLQTWKDRRVVVTVSHDPEFVRQADEIRVMEGGRLVDSGTFDELQERSEVFRRIMRQA